MVRVSRAALRFSDTVTHDTNVRKALAALLTFNTAVVEVVPTEFFSFSLSTLC